MGQNLKNKRDPISIASAQALPAAGAYTGPFPVVAINARLARSATLILDYVSGGAGGAVQVVVLYSTEDNITNVSVFRPMSIVNGALALIPAPATYTGYAASVGAWIIRIVPDTGRTQVRFSLDGSVKWLRFDFAEFGNVGAPGSVTASIALDEGP